ncbi:aminoacyl-tRNA hydrolase [Buchnera aphidicola]|uniref:Peptidyl-tRNA hydrolase n=1 Tax=Buchnera aphidicola str. Ua (Uroleucon ambrosiae) TaxID=1005057 RepID=G2LP64_BUCUM|nr:aminoacyl-tRNA hydrolase [Buchnera aphidicola]AEO08001.1 peptidyl-tRNA hydrolase [Buchnera aphidicola str. Ua (Uroleucon ambrosiae)]
MIVGLANPKKEYDNTRHNVGSWYIYALAKYYSQHFKKEDKFFGFTSFCKIESYYIRLFIPNIFMNINGQAIFKIASFYNFNLNEILIVHDDLELPPGTLKFKYSYGHNGHNGLRNIINIFNKKINFSRFRIGIGRPEEKKKVASFVLSMPTEEEKILIQKSILNAIEKKILINYLEI